MRMLKKLHANEKAQVLPMFVMLLVVLVGMLGLATDLGRVWVARAQLGRSVDAAALAGAKQLPDTALADAKARAYIAENEPGGNISVQVAPNAATRQVAVTATRSVNTVFMKLLGIGSVEVSNEATAGFGVISVDAVLAIDNTGSMGDSPCNGSQNNTGCPIHEAKNAAINFTNTLLPSTDTLVGVTGFRGCFKPGGTANTCVPVSSIGYLDSNVSSITSKIGLMNGNGGSGTNVCSGLDMANTILTTSPGASTEPNAIREIIILSDGDNNYNSIAYVSGSPGSPVTICRPSTSGCPVSPSSECDPADSDASPACGAAQPRERQLDKKTMALADSIKAAGIEIFVVGFGVCGSEDGVIPTSATGALTPNYCENIGNTTGDTSADQRLLKCMAASSDGTNDHYFRANAATELPGIFTKIAQQIAFRLVK
jgi:Putative Flp pilus-assembly TadE/G-like